MKTKLLLLASLMGSFAMAADYTLDFSGATLQEAEAPVLRRAEMAVAVGSVPAVAVGDMLNLKLFGDVDFALRIVSAPPAGIAGQSFIARDEKGSASAIVKVSKESARISVDDFMNRRQFTVRCKDGKVLIVERDNSQVEEGECGTCASPIETSEVTTEAPITLKSAAKSRTLLGVSGNNEFPVSEQKSVVDILVAFDKGAKAWAESSNWPDGDTIQEFADYAVNKMNMVLEKSQLLDTFSYRLVGVTEVDDTYRQINQTLLLNLRARVGALAKLSQLREKYGADTITLLIDKKEGGTTGIGFGYYPISSFPDPQTFDGMNYACNVCDIKTVYSRYTMSHETGHNMGCDHSTRQGPDNSGPGRYDDASGYHFVDANGDRRYTIMGYNYTYDDNYTYSPVPYFSSPDIVPDEYGCAVGVVGTNNNRRALLQTHGDIAGLREHVKPYDWDIKFLDDNGKEIPDGTYFPSSCNVTLTNSNPNAEIYYTQNGSTPTPDSSHCNPGGKITVYLYSPKTLTACAVTNGVAISTRSITLRGGLTWSGDANGNGVWASNDSSAKPWSEEHFGGDPVVFPDLADISCATVTVQDAVSPESVWFRACDTGYVFDKGTDDAQINIPDAAFAPAGDVTFNVPVKLDATGFTNLNGRAITFNAPFGQTVNATSGYCTNAVTILPYGKLTVAPGAGKTQTFDKLNNISFSSNATFRVGTGTVVFKGAINSGAGVIGRTKLEVGNGGNLVFDVPGGGGTGYQMDQTSLTVENGGRVTYNDMELLKRTLYLDGGTIYAKRFDLMKNPGVYATDDSSIENNGGGYILIRDSDSEINVSNGKTFTLNVGTQTDGRTDTSGWGIIKRGGGTLAANGEFKHSGVTDIEGGTIEVGYSSGSTVYGQGWIVADGATLKVKDGCTLKVPSLTLDYGATLVLPSSGSTPPLVVTGTDAVNINGVNVFLEGADNLYEGSSYQILSSSGGFSGTPEMDGMPELADGLEWAVEQENGTLYAKVVLAGEKPTIDILVAFDRDAQAYVANKNVTLEAFAQTQIDRMNDVLATNRLDRFYSYRLVGVCKVDGTYNDIDTAPSLATSGVGAMVSLRAARELYGADTVTLLVDTTGATIGNSSPLNSPNDVASQHECAFSVCSISAVDTGKQHTMIHENAHNMGCGHARAQSTINSPFDYGRGYYFQDGNITRHTIMAYGGDNNASWYFSTSSKAFGYKLGDATNNNARVLKETCAYVAQWREAGATNIDVNVTCGDVTWQTSKKYPWSVDGNGIVRSFNQTDYTYPCTTPLKATIEGPKRLSFSHKSYFGGESVAGSNYSHFDVLLNDSPVLAQTECTNDWIDAYVDIPDGTNEVTFAFSQRYAMNNPNDNKDGNAATDDAVWIKDFVLGDPVEPETSRVIFSNTDFEPNRANLDVTNAVKISIAAVPDLGIAIGTLIKVVSLDFGKVKDDSTYRPADKISISDGVTIWTSAFVVTNETDRFPKMSNNTDLVNRLVYSFEETNCILTAGTEYDLTLLDAEGNRITKVRYALAENGAKIITGMDMTAGGKTYTPMMQLKGEIASNPSFDWTPGSAPTGWFTGWDGENGGGTHPVIGPDGLSTNLYVTYHASNNESQKWHPYKSGVTAMGDYTFLVYGSADSITVTNDNLAVLWCMGARGAEKTALVKDQAGNIKLVQVSGTTATASRTIDAGPADGYHLFTVRFNETDGASLQIDDGEQHSDPLFTKKSGAGFQVGSVLSGSNTPFERYAGFAALKMLAFGTDSIPSWQYEQLCKEYPAVTNHVLVTIGSDKYYRLRYAKAALEVGTSFTVSGDVSIDLNKKTISSPISGEVYTFAELGQGVTINDNGDGTYSLVKDMATDAVLRISEIMPKPTDAQNRGALEGMDVNGLESGWVEVENTSDQWADLADYRFIRVNRGKKTDPAGFGNFPSVLIPPKSRFVFYTSERYSNSKDQAVSAFEHGTFDGKPMIMGDELGGILVWGDKVNPKKSPYVRLYYAPGGNIASVVDTVVVPSDVPEGYSIIVGEAEEGEGTRRWLCPTPTRGTANTSTDGLARLGPNVGPLYEKKGQKKTEYANEFAVPTPPAKPGVDYVVTLPINGVMNPDGTFTPRNADQITSVKLVYRKDLDDTTRTTGDNVVATKTTVENWGDQYTATIPSSFFPERGHLIQWKVLITDNEGVEWTSPSFNNPDDGYEWYGTIVEAPELESGNLPTWHMFASGDHLTQMDVDKDKQNLTKVPNYARVAIYDSSTSNYYDYVRIDLRGNTSAGFTKKGHGLRFAKAHPLTMTDVVTGETIEEIRKTSLISEYADPSYMRQMIAFWLWRKMGNKVPFDFPVRCNLNGEFYQLAFNSERFTDELIEDVYGLDKFGYGYKNVGTLKSNTGTTAGKIEKKTPDDEDESNITVLQNELRAKIIAAQNVSSSPDGGDTGLDNADLTKFVVQKFNLPAWLNYLASARITQEMDDVWANVCAYYDNAEMKEGVRGTDTWMPLGYDFNLSFGQYFHDDGVDIKTLMSNQDWFKSHPLYGGNRIRCYTSDAKASTISAGNDGFEAVWQSSKFRRLYLRRLRTLMDQELKEPGTVTNDTPFMVKMREMADLMRADAALDTAKWPNDNSDNAIDAWRSTTRPADIDAGIDDIWDNYVVPRREHLYVTHSVTNTAKTIGYGSNLNAGIPESQSPIATLAPNISIANLTALDAEQAEALGVTGQFYDTKVVEIRNDNDEVVDMSGWKLAFSVDFTFPAGTVCDANDSISIVADRRTYIETHDTELTDQVIVGNATFTGAGPIALYAADGTLVYSAIPQTNELRYLRLHSFYGNTLDGGDKGEWFTLTNISDSVTLDLADVTVCFLKQGDDHDTTDHCHVTLENKNGKGNVKPLKSWTAQQSDYADKGWTKIQNNKQQITIYDKYGSVCQSLKVTQKTFPLAYGNGGYLVCDSIAASVTKDSDWHEALYELANNGALSENFSAEDQAAANELVANAKPVLSDDDIAAGLDAQYLTIVAEPVADEEGKYKAVVAVNPETVGAPVIAEPAAASDPVEVEEDKDGNKSVSVSISNAVLGLWYGYGVADELGKSAVFTNDIDSFERATNATHKVKGSPRTKPSGFFRIKVLPNKPNP